MRTVADILRRHARERPDQMAMLFEGRETTYRELDRRASRVANALHREGLGPGSRFAVLDKNSDSFYELLFGAARANCVLVPVNWRLAGPEIAYVLKDAGAALLFVGADFAELIEGLRDQLTDVHKIISLADERAGAETYTAWRDGASQDELNVPVGSEDVVVQMYTSGTTGHPKGAQLTNANLTSEVTIGADEVGIWGEDDVALVAMPQFHIAGTIWGVIALCVGAKAVIMRDVDPVAILDSFEADRITKAFFVPAVLLFLLQVPGCAERDFSTLDLICYGGSPMPTDLLRRAMPVFGCGFGHVYGLTEVCGAITNLSPADHRDPSGDRLLSCGKALSNCEIRVVEAGGAPVPAGEIGEIVCRGPTVMKGYWNLPEATTEALRGGWFHTGDAGYLDGEGYIYIYDRVKDLIVSGGENIYPAEVENALADHPAVADVAVIGVPDERWGEAVKAVVVKMPDTEISAEELIAFARNHIAGYKLPRSVDFIDVLPRNPAAKILKRELRKPYWEGRERQV